VWGSIKWNRLDRRCSDSDSGPGIFTTTTSDYLDFFVNEARGGDPTSTYYSEDEDKRIYEQGCGVLQVRPFSGYDEQ
jgi:hypothetical protein